MEDSSTQLVEVDIRYNVGSREDPEGKAGLAHLVEHMMFQIKPPVEGSDIAPPPLMAQISAKTTYFNAYTNWDTTHYQNAAMADRTEELLKTEAQRLYYKCQTVSEDEFLREREVVRNEIRQRGGDAKGQIPQLIASSVYPKGHAYERMIGGDDKQLTSITQADVCEFMNKYYTPENATVVVAGGIKTDEVVGLIGKLFNAVPKVTTAPRKEVAPVATSAEETTVELDIERPVIAVSWALPPSNTTEGERARYGINQVFFRTAIKASEYDFAVSIDPAVLGGELAPMFSMIMELKDMSKKAEALEFARKAAARAHEGFEDGFSEQVAEDKARAKADLIRSFEPLSARTQLIAQEVQFNTKVDFDSNDLYMFKELDKIESFSADQIGAAVKKSISPSKMRVMIFKPSANGLKGDARAKIKFQTKSHESREAPDVDPTEARRPIKLSKDIKGLSAAQRFVMDNGMNVVLLQVKAMPLATVNLMFNNAGATANPANPSIGFAAADYLDLPLDAEFGRAGISVSCQGDTEAAFCGTSGINIYLDLMLNAVERIVVAGEYSQKGIETQQKGFKNRYNREQIESNEYRRQIMTAIFGPDHPYTKTVAETPETVGKISQDALDEFRRKYYVAGNATLVVAGDFDLAKTESKVRDLFGGWGKGSVSPAIPPTQFQRSGPTYVGVVAKEEPQLTVTIAYPAPAGIDGQSGARSVLAEMLNLRMGDVRFKLGSTYGVYAGIRTNIGPSRYQMGGTVDAERAGESIAAMRAGVDMIRKGENFDEDFVRARRKELQDRLGLSTVTRDLAGQLIQMAQFNLPPTYYTTNLQQIATTPTALVKAIVASELNPANEVIVLKGSRAQLEKAFRDAKISDVKYVEPQLPSK
jgi:zinc protease